MIANYYNFFDENGIILQFEDLKESMLTVINLLVNALKANIIHKQSFDV